MVSYYPDSGLGASRKHVNWKTASMWLKQRGGERHRRLKSVSHFTPGLQSRIAHKNCCSWVNPYDSREKKEPPFGVQLQLTEVKLVTESEYPTFWKNV